MWLKRLYTFDFQIVPMKYEKIEKYTLTLEFALKIETEKKLQTI